MFWMADFSTENISTKMNIDILFSEMSRRWLMLKLPPVCKAVGDHCLMAGVLSQTDYLYENVYILSGCVNCRLFL